MPDDLVIGLDGRRTRRLDLAQQLRELQILQHGPEPLRIGARPAGLRDIERHRDIAAHGGEVARETRDLGSALDALPYPLGTADRERLDGGRILEDGVERPETRHQRRRRLLPDARHPRDPVRRIADEPEDIGDALGNDAEALGDLGHADAPAAHLVVELDVVPDDLHQILVGSHYHRAQPGPTRLSGQRSDHVVGLDPGHLDHRDPHRVHERPNVGKLRPELVGQWRAVLLVLRVTLVPERGTRSVEDADHAFRALVPEQLEQHASESQDRVRGDPVSRGERRQGVKGAVHVCARVDQVQARRRGVRARGQS
jgi:hypothetical protein